MTETQTPAVFDQTDPHTQPQTTAADNHADTVQPSDAAQTHYLRLQQQEQNGIPQVRHIPQYAALGEQGHLGAQLTLMHHYGQTADSQSLYWAERAAEAGAAEAHYHLARHHQRRSNHTEAQQHYRKAAQAGSAAAHWQLGKIHHYGIGSTPDDRLAEQHLQQAAQAGHTCATVLLAELLAAQNRPEAIDHYRTAADRGHAGAQAALAKHLLTGTLTTRDPHAAVRYARLGAAQNHPEALSLTGDIYRYGIGTKADNDNARRHYLQAAAAGSASALQKLLSEAALYKPAEYERLKALALRQQHLQQTFQTAQTLSEGRNGHTDRTRARHLYLEAAEFHHSQAAAELGRIYLYGLNTRPDAHIAAYWFTIAAEQNHPGAQYHLACLYRHGHGTAHSNTQACHWLQQAIQNGHDSAEALRPLLTQWQQETPTPQTD